MGEIVKSNKVCFFVSGFGKPDSPERVKSDLLFNEVIIPVCGYLKYNPVRADRDEYSPALISKLGEHLSNDELVIADITNDNPNVFYELGARHALHKPCILIKDINFHERPFDIRSIGVIDYDLENLTSFKELILSAFQNFEKSPLDLIVPFIPNTGSVELILGESKVLTYLTNHKKYTNEFYLSIWCIPEDDVNGIQEYFEDESKLMHVEKKIRLINTDRINSELIINHVKMFKDDILSGNYAIYSTKHTHYEIIVLGQLISNDIYKQIAVLLIPDRTLNVINSAVASENEHFVTKFVEIYNEIKQGGEKLILNQQGNLEEQVSSWIARTKS